MTVYDPRFPTILSADASSFGLGAVFFQIQRNAERRPIAFASRTLTKTEQRYAQVEKEALALTWASERFDEYIRGIDVTFETDHKPLVSLLGKMPIDLWTPRVQRFRMRLMRYQLQMVYIPGKSLITADTLSRAPMETDKLAGELTVWEVSSFVKSCVQGLQTGNNFVNRVRDAQKSDVVCQDLLRWCRQGWTEKPKLPCYLVPYWQEQALLSECNGMLLKGSRLVVP